MWIVFRGENVIFVNQFKNAHGGNGEHFEVGAK